MPYLPTAFHRLLEPLDRRVVNRIVAAHDGNLGDGDGDHAWTCRRHLKSLLFAQFAGLGSLREIEQALAARPAALYKKRWEIELFFEWIKQNLRIKSFLGRSENAVKIQIYLALIAFILLSLFRQSHASSANASPKTLLARLKVALLDPFDLVVIGARACRRSQRRRHLPLTGRVPERSGLPDGGPRRFRRLRDTRLLSGRTRAARNFRLPARAPRPR